MTWRPTRTITRQLSPDVDRLELAWHLYNHRCYGTVDRYRVEPGWLIVEIDGGELDSDADALVDRLIRQATPGTDTETP